MAHRAQKRDANEREIIEALTALGVWVDQLDGGNGRMDLACAEPRNHSWFMLEVKVPGEGRLTPLQKKYHAACPGRIHLIETVAGAIAVAVRYMQPGGFNGIHERDTSAVFHAEAVHGVVDGGRR